MLIDGLTLKIEKNSDGKEILRFYADNKGKNRYIQVEKHGNDAATLVYLEDGVVPGIEEGEELELLQQSDKYLERLVRAMAYLHMDVEDAANGYTMIDVEFIRRGFQVRFALDGLAAWVKTSNVATIVMSKLEEKGLPSPEDREFQGVFNGPYIGIVRVISMGLRELLDFYDKGTYATHIHPGQMMEFLLRENGQVERPN